jgi:hypothetical protein
MRNPARATADRSMDSTEELLTLRADGTVKQVFIQVTEGVVYFSSSSDGPFVFTGLTWQQDSEYGLFINFVFIQTGDQILELTYKTPLFWLSQPIDNTQMCCVPSIPGTYKFFVNTANGKVDPKIVVTPL